IAVQECTTDSEELMYHQVRASSSCSAPPDLLLVSERDNNIQLRSPVVNIITTPPGNASGSASKHHNQHHSTHPHHHNHNSNSNAGRHPQSGHPHPQDVSSGGGSHSKHLRISSGSNGRHGKYSNMQQGQPQDEDVVDAAAAMTQQQQQHGGHTTTHSRHLHHHKEERIRLEEFTCDVSVEGGKSSQPLQFSFTFYDLDGHHGKITKDDIVGIVYTIYESIGKSVVVPHCGSKTINVRLTVSPEGKSKAQPVPNVGVGAGFGASKLKKLPTGLAAMSKTVAGTGGSAGTGAGATALTTSVGSRRQHRYRPRKLIKSDDEDDDSNSEKDAVPSTEQQHQPSGSGGKAGGKTGHHHQARYHQKNNARPEQCCPEQNTPDNGQNTYENMLNLKCCKPESSDRDRDLVDCPTGQRQHHLHSHQQQQQQRQQDIYMKQATQRVKMLRRARKQKYQDHCLETRQRSLSVGNDSSWQNRHLQQQQPQTVQASPAQPLNHKSVSVSPPLGGAGAGVGDLMLDGVQLRQPRPQSLTHQQQQQQQQQQRKSAECWKSALNRNDLISIIRESMEKNRLCFQLNGKPQANVSPIRQPAAQQQQQPQQQQRQRCNTGSKIPTLIANHSPVAQQSPLSCSPPTADTTCIPVAPASNEVSAGHQQQHQQQQQQHHSHHEHPQPHIPIYHQQLAINPAVLAAQQTHNTAHNKLNLCGYDSFLHATICGGGAAAHSPPPTPSNVATVQPIPKKNQKNLLQGYQRLDQQQQQQQKEQKEQRSSKDYRNYGNLIYAKLSEQLQQKEREQRRHRHKQQQQQNQLLQEKHREPEQAEQRPPTSNSSSGGSKIYGDALECAHLLASEEEDLPPSPQLTSTPSKVVSTDTLIDLNDDVGEAVAEAVTEGGKQSLEAEECQAQEVELDTSASSSMIHRYVHEHIHHHYHHFKEQQDV
ncbi:hypothetical protein KR032_004217, partial [Drosophila birchii]